MSLASLQTGEPPVAGPAMAVPPGMGVVFTLYLTYLELFVIHAICRWCVASGAIILAIFGVALLDQRMQSRSEAHRVG